MQIVIVRVLPPERQRGKREEKEKDTDLCQSEATSAMPASRGTDTQSPTKAGATQTALADTR